MLPKFILNFTFFIILIPFLFFVCAVPIVSLGLVFHQHQVFAEGDAPSPIVSLLVKDEFADSYHYDQSGYQAEKLSYNDNHPTDSAALENYRITFVQYSSQPPLSMQQYPQSPQMSIPPTYTSPSPPLQSGPPSQSNQLSPLPSTTGPASPSTQMSPQQPGSPPALVPPSAITRIGPTNSSINLPTQNPNPPPGQTPQFTGNSALDATPPETIITSVVDGNNSTLVGQQARQLGQAGNNNINNNINTAISSMNPQSNTSAASNSTKIMFTFAGTDNVAIAGFECGLDKPLPSPDSASSALVSAFASNNVFSCSNRVVIGGLVPGTTHVFEVRAVDSSGIRDPSPARFEWRVVNGSTIPVSSSQNNTSLINTSKNISTSNSTLNGNRTAYAQQQSQAFMAHLTGKDEVPPVKTQATGTAQIQLSSDGKEISYDLTATNLNGFMMAHIHQGKAGENGQPVAALQTGIGKITASDLQGPFAGKQISDLVDLIKGGEAYVNVHTQLNQNGEIRGQIMTG
jgi:hypothetical protein